MTSFQKTLKLVDPKHASCNLKQIPYIGSLTCYMKPYNNQTCTQSIKWFCSKEECIMHCKYFEYLHKKKHCMFSIFFAIMQAKLYLPGTIIGRVSLFSYGIYFAADTPLSVCISRKFINIAKYVRLNNNGAREMRVSSLDGADDGR